MATPLDRLLEQIDPSRTIDDVERRINQFLAGYAQDQNTVSTWDEYRECLAEFMRQARNAALTAPPTAGQDIDMNFHEAIVILRRIYPGNTEQIVFDIMRTGAEGGVYAVFRALGKSLAEQYAQNEIDGRIYAFFNTLTTEEIIALPDEYIEKYKDILPSEFINDSVIRMRGNFWKVLQDHPRMIKRIRDIG